jgi:hypothetical protein
VTPSGKLRITEIGDGQSGKKAFIIYRTVFTGKLLVNYR